MKEISKEIREYIQSHYKKPYKEIVKMLRFSQMQEGVLNNIHNLITDANIKWYDEAKNTIFEIDNIPKGTLYHDIPENFKKIIDTSLKQEKTYEMTIASRKITVTFYDDANKSHSVKKWTEYLKKIYIWISVISKFASSSCAEHLFIYIYLTKEKKQLPDDISTLIGRKHANTAFTTACTPNTEIHLYREEEWFKVFIHETFHSYGLDFSTMENNNFTQQILEIFGIHSDVRLYESYTEIWAEIIHICFFVHFSMIKNHKLENLDKYIQKIEEIMAIEVVFSMIQCAKILKRHNLTYEDISSKNRLKILEKYKEETPVFSYYIVKSILLFSINDFIEWTMIHNRGTIQFHKTNHNVKMFIGFIEKHSTIPKYRELMKMVENCVNIHTNNQPTSISILKTLRMTVHEE